MKYIQRKTNVRQHNRQTKHKVANVRNHERNLKPRRMTGVIPVRSLRYKQAKTIFPSLKAYGDADQDGVINKRDCRPFDGGRQDDAQDLIDSSDDDLTLEEQERVDYWKDENKEERDRNFLKEQADMWGANPEEERRPQFEGTPEEQEQASENISDILSAQKRKERGEWEFV